MSSIFTIFGITFSGFLSGLVLSFVLGLLHGVTPDEHTWPITFSYAVGSYSTRAGAEAGLVFSLGFTIERAVLSEIFYIILSASLGGVASFLQSALFFGIVYVFVGFAMAFAGYYIKYGNWYPHIELDRLVNLLNKGSKHESTDFYKKKVPIKMAIVHGLIAGFGMGAFAFILFFTVVPSMPNVYVGFLPGALFGVGTMIAQIGFGAVFGKWITSVKRINKRGLEFVARYISSSILLYGGIIFVIAGLAVVMFPPLLSFGIATGVRVPNLDYIDIGFILVVIVVVALGVISYLKAISIASKKFRVPD
jgi:hypothetical protein